MGGGRFGTLSKLLVTHSQRPLGAKATHLISFQGIVRIFLASGACPKYVQRVDCWSIFADTALSEYRRTRATQRRHLGMALLTRSKGRGKTRAHACARGRLPGFKTCRKPNKRTLHHPRFDKGRLGRDNRGAISHHASEWGGWGGKAQKKIHLRVWSSIR